MYRRNKFCVDDTYGPGWRSSYGTFADWAVDGVDASMACCGCGRGTCSSDKLWLARDMAQWTAPPHSECGPEAAAEVLKDFDCAADVDCGYVKCNKTVPQDRLAQLATLQCPDQSPSP
eukprot:EG_transcript_25715